MKFRTEAFEISILKIRIFMKCMELKNYSRVASEFNYTPSMISRTITSMENLLGLQLFIRQYHALTPTPAARELEKIWAPVVECFVNGIEQAHKIQEGNVSCIKIGLLDTTQRTADYIMSKFREALPDYMMDRMIWERRDMHELTSMIEDGYYDLIITWNNEQEFFNQKDICWKEIVKSENAVFIHKNHPLYDREIKNFEEFKPYPFLILSPAIYPHYYHMLENVCKAYGFSPKIAGSAPNTNSIRYNLSLGKGQLLADGLVCDWESCDIRKVELDDLGESGLILAWNTGRMNGFVQKIIDIF